MQILAVAGGTSPSLGRSIVSAVLAAIHCSPSWTVRILSRTTKIPPWLQAIDPSGQRTQIRAVDYLSTKSLVPVLEGATILISVTSATDGTQGQIQINLLHAAVEAGVKRFAPSQWGFGPKGYEFGIVKWVNEGVWEECLKFIGEGKGKIEVARFNNGIFMNYLGHGLYGDSEKGELGMMKEDGYRGIVDRCLEGVQGQGDMPDGSGAFLVSVRSGKAEIPVKDDGNWPRVSMTSMRDIGRFVAASLELKSWEADMSMAGDTITMGELIGIVEELTESKLEVQKLTREVNEEKMPKLGDDRFMERLWLEFKILCCDDEEGVAVLRPVLNRLCPAVKPLSVREYLAQHYPVR